jgi:hypothetical protein
VVAGARTRRSDFVAATGKPVGGRASNSGRCFVIEQV